MRPNLHSFGLELMKLSEPQGFVQAVKERGGARVMKEYLDHSALNAGQAARDVRYFLNHPDADDVAPPGTIKHKLTSAKKRARSLANNLFYTLIPPHSHHEAIDLMSARPVRTKAMFLRGYKPWDYPDPTKAP